jgi:hypothetical protein
MGAEHVSGRHIEFTVQVAVDSTLFNEIQRSFSANLRQEKFVV